MDYGIIWATEDTDIKSKMWRLHISSVFTSAFGVIMTKPKQRYSGVILLESSLQRMQLLNSDTASVSLRADSSFGLHSV